MKNVLLLHGTIFDPKMVGREHLNNWLPWLKKEQFKKFPELLGAIIQNV